MKKNYSESQPSCKVTFSLPKAAVKDAKSVLLLGDFNNWEESEAISLKEMTDGSFLTEVELGTGRNYEFRYLIDSERWENDWEADNYVASPYPGVQNSVVSLDAVETEISSTNGHEIAVEEQATLEVASKVEATKAVEEKPIAKKKPSKKAKTPKEDLKKIEGIGPKIAGLLEEAGINSFQKLSEASVENIREILVAAGSRYKAFDPTTWPKQAQMAAKGNWDELKKWQKELLGGKVKKSKK